MLGAVTTHLICLATSKYSTVLVAIDCSLVSGRVGLPWPDPHIEASSTWTGDAGYGHEPPLAQILDRYGVYNWCLEGIYTLTSPWLFRDRLMGLDKCQPRVSALLCQQPEAWRDVQSGRRRSPTLQSCGIGCLGWQCDVERIREKPIANMSVLARRIL